jgi:hypothetical protein
MVLRNMCDYDAPNVSLNVGQRTLTLALHMTIQPYLT